MVVFIELARFKPRWKVPKPGNKGRHLPGVTHNRKTTAIGKFHRQKALFVVCSLRPADPTQVEDSSYTFNKQLSLHTQGLAGTRSWKLKNNGCLMGIAD